jgi:DNA-binding Lrp family transcriptional regulator
MAYTLDEVDNRIIYELDANCRIPETRLAKMVGKSKESVRYRIRRLREEGVITGFTTYVDT